MRKPATKLFAPIAEKQWADAMEYLANLDTGHPGNTTQDLLMYALATLLPVMRASGGQINAK